MNKKQIEKDLKTLTEKIDLLLPPTRSAVLLHEWLSHWLTVYKLPALSPKYSGVLRCAVQRIKDTTENKPLNGYAVQEFVQAVYGIPLSYTRAVVYSVLNMAYTQAVKEGLTNANPIENVPPPKHTRKRGKALTLEQQRQFLQVIENDTRKPLYMFYLLTGCRRAEALSVEWSDIDFERKRIHIRGTKTPRADRFVPLFPQLSPILEQLPRDGARLFPFTDNMIKGYWQRLKRKNAFGFRLHDLRHTFATRALESGISLATVSKWLGHVSVAITADIYMHVLTEFERAEIRKFDPQL